MLNLRLRDEFLGAHMPGTAIALRRTDKTGAAEQGPEQILGITYPTLDSLDRGDWVDGEEFFERLRQREEKLRPESR